MNQTAVILFWIVVVIIVLLFLSTQCNTKSGAENFYTYNGYYKSYCPSCGWRSRYSCSKCNNCGYCITPSGYGECVPGDSSGPYFRDDCLYWEFGDPYYYYPYSNISPVVKVKSLYPYKNYKYNLLLNNRYNNVYDSTGYAWNSTYVPPYPATTGYITSY